VLPRHPAQTFLRLVAGVSIAAMHQRGDGALALHWFTTDLRLRDNPALALAEGPVAGVFVRDPALLARHAGATRRLAFMDASLAALDAALRARGSRLLVLEGDPAAVLPPLAAALGAATVTHAEALEPAARARTARAARALSRDGLVVRAAEASLVQSAGTVLAGGERPYRVYSAFARAWERLPLRSPVAMPRAWAPAERLAAAVPAAAAGAPALRDPDLPAAGEDAAAARLARFLADAVAGYRVRRDLPAVDGTSRLSWHLRWGTLSAAAAVRRAQAVAERDPAAPDGVRAWVRELAWRDFYAHLVAASADPAERRSVRPALPCRVDDAAFRRWRDGTTGIPLVDAGMRQLRATGWMHNRLRMITASFLTKHLLLDWRLGEAHFWTELLDGQLSQNRGGWQWVAGCGADAQPFYRIFSPTRQGARFDPEGAYVKQWVPELARVPARQVHEPWTLSALERRALCPDYPAPVVTLEEGRARALAAWERSRATGR